MILKKRVSDNKSLAWIEKKFFIVYYDITNNVYFIFSLEIKTRKEEKKNEHHQRNENLIKCAFDCESFGHICCRLGDGIQECRKKINCPDPGKYFSGFYQGVYLIKL